MTERVQKILSRWGIASRRKAEQLILEGRVSLNGQTVYLGQQADPETDRLEVDGQPIHPGDRPEPIYLLLHKPLGVVSTCHDPQNRTTVLDLLPRSLRQGQGIHPVGRLDINSTGALLLTNDGQLTLSLTHPRYHLPKTYEVLLDGHLSEKSIQKWREGVMLEGKRTLPAQIQILALTPHQTLLQVILTEGRNRQIRRVVEQLGFQVLKLHRTAIGIIQLDHPQKPQLPSGHHRLLEPSEIAFLQRHIHLGTRPKLHRQNHYVSQKA
jgi:23S rRNA pseudouridine2605 synthase